MPLILLRLHATPDLGTVLWAEQEDASGRLAPLPDLAPLLDAADGPLGARIEDALGPRTRARHRLSVLALRDRVPCLPAAGATLAPLLAAVRAAVLDPLGEIGRSEAPALLARLVADSAPVRLTENLLAAPELLAGAAADLAVAEAVRDRHVVPILRRAWGTVEGRWRLAPDRGAEAEDLLTSALPELAEDRTGAAAADTILSALADARARAAFRPIAEEHPRAGSVSSSLAQPDRPLELDRADERRIDMALADLAASGTVRRDLEGDAGDLVVRLFEPEVGDVWPLEPCRREESGAVRPLRDLVAAGEVAAGEGVEDMGRVLARSPMLRGAGTESDGWSWLLTTSRVVHFLDTTVADLQDSGITVLLPRDWTTARPTLRLEVDDVDPDAQQPAGSGVGLGAIAKFRWRVALGDAELTDAEMDALTSEQAELVRLRGEWVRIDSATLRRATEYVDRFRGKKPPVPPRPARADTEAGTEAGAGAAPPAEGRVLGVGGFLASLSGDHAPPVEIDRVDATGSAAPLLDTDGAGTIGTVGSPPLLEATLRPYQQRGLDWLAFLDTQGMGGILADDMGLGKTIQLLALLAWERRDGEWPGPTLLVCPMSVVGSWQREARKFTPSLRVLVHHGADRDRTEGFLAATQHADLVLTTYALLARDLPLLQRAVWHRIVLDEAQHIKNSRTAVARSATAIEAPHRIALTGTPVENRLAELRSIMDFANPGLLPGPSRFQEQYATPIERDDDPAALARLTTITRPFLLRRLKTDPTIISDLPDKNEITTLATLTPEQAGLYEALVQDMLLKLDEADAKQKRGLVVSTLMKLKQVCNHPAQYLQDGSGVLTKGAHRSGKLELIDDMLDAALDRGEKTLVFTQFTQLGDLLLPYWEQRLGQSIPFLHGGVAKAERDRMVAEFQREGAGPSLMLLSLRAGGTGLTLTAANNVIHVDRWWNPAVEDQATDRAYRIGQRKDVQVAKMVCSGTVEERIDRVLAGKSHLADLTLSAGEGWLADLDSATLHDLFALDDSAVDR